MKFLIDCTKPIYDNESNYNGVEEAQFVYDNETSEIYNPKGKLLNIRVFNNTRKYSYVLDKAVSKDTPGIKTHYIKTLKIQMGLSCNYSCEYCSQRFVPNIDHANTKYMNKFIESLDSWLFNAPEKIEFWGGEPFVYWKTLKPLAELLREKYPLTRFSVITNGSLITEEIIDWLYNTGFTVAVSHDGPGQNVRGPDPFEDKEQRKILFKLFNRFLPENRISINSMIHRENMDREKIQKFFEELFNLHNEDFFVIGEGGFIDVYDEGGKMNVPQNIEEHITHRRITLKVIKNNSINRFNVLHSRINSWIDSWGNYRSSDTIGQKCGMDDEDTIAVDLQGNVLTCQNVTAVSKAPNGNSHKIGHVSRFDSIKLNTSTHWKFREECSNCPVLQVCQGSCMFIEGEYFKLSCDAAYSDHIPFFAAAFELATNGYLPVKITAISDEYNLPDDRADIWGSFNGISISEVSTRTNAIEKNKLLEKR
jgi:uncharacterized protein